MSFHSKITATSAVALMSASAAFADVTAQDVWDNWQQSLAIYGEGGVTIGSENMVGSALQITDLTMMMSDTDVDVTSTIPSIVFTENGDGTVSVTMSDSYTIEIADSPENVATILVSQSGANIVVSGDPGAMTYEMAADRIAVSLDQITDRGETIPADALLALNGLSGSYTSTMGDLNTVTYDVAVGGIDMLVDVTEPGGEGYFNFSGQIAGMGLVGAVSMPADMDLEAPETIFIDGFAVDVGYEFGQSAYLFDFQDGSDAANGTMSAGEGSFRLAVDYDNLVYETGLGGLAVAVAGSDIPLPVEFTLGEIGMGLDMPLSKTDAAVPLAANFTLRDLAVSEMIWGMVDPGGMLSHEPATAVIQLTGLGRLFYDLMDPAQAMEAASAGIPGELNSLSLDELIVSAAAAELLGSGAFTFDFSDFGTIPGVPRPEGSVTFNINGLNGLLDTLVQMGLAPEEEIMGARMMMGMFANAVGDDMLESTFEVNAEGHVIANGQRIQ